MDGVEKTHTEAAAAAAAAEQQAQPPIDSAPALATTDATPADTDTDTDTAVASAAVATKTNKDSDMEVEPTVPSESNPGANAQEDNTSRATTPTKASVEGATASIFSTPARNANAVRPESLSEAIAGATPGKHVEPQFKCVYPPDELTQGLIVEHFGFLPISFIDEIINAANDTVYRATDALSKFVEKEQGTSEATSQAVNKAETLLEHAVDKNFDKFELYALRNLFNIPQELSPYVVLPHRLAEAESGAPVFAEDEAELDRKLEQVRRELVANNLLKTKLQHDMEKVEHSTKRLRALNEQLCVDEISKRVFESEEPVSVSETRARGKVFSELVDRVEKLNFVSADGPLAKGPQGAALQALGEPAGRDVYLARMADIHVASWESRQPQTPTN
ncbi:hypothetical protein GGI07_000451 [Coemansia sp. Benny D115]|nr:hypothetical protein GGI07_000451 [Coemansia sp. Benny D115]